MLTDLHPMAPCPGEKRGRHHLAAILPGEDTGDVTLFCEMCGMVRRMPVAGALVGESLDMVEGIDALVDRLLKPS